MRSRIITYEENQKKLMREVKALKELMAKQEGAVKEAQQSERVAKGELDNKQVEMSRV